MIDPDALDGILPPEQQGQVRGHAAIIAGIDQQLVTGRLPSALLLHGPQGIGKATLAFHVARTILTATGDEDAHRVSEQIASGSHPNVRILRKAPKDGKGFYTSIRVDEVRDLRARLQQTRGRQGQRIAIVDSIDDCNPSAANALLKTLEEPPADTTFFLISHRPGQLLPTIRSRCHSLALRPLADGDVRAVLLAQKPELTAAELDRAVALAGGRPRRAFETLALADDSPLGALNVWLQAPTQPSTAAHLQIAELLGADTQSTELSFAREMITDYLADEARNAAISGARMRLASANELWDKAQGLFDEADSINLDMKQTLVAIFDAIRKHIQTTAPLSTEPQ